MKLEVDLGKDSYPIYFKKGLLKNLGEYIQEVFKEGKIALITDANVDKYYGFVQGVLEEAGYQVKKIVLPPGETTKEIGQAVALYGELLEYGLTRKDLIITLGGGVVGDLGGFVAATYLRGVDFIQIPTSLLAQIDSSIGGKVGIDLPFGKNLVGAFHQPKMVLIDPLALKTLEDRYFIDGMGEAIKYGAALDKSFFAFLEENDFKKDDEDVEKINKLIFTCCKLKKDIVEEDEKEQGRRVVLNFGHSIGHCLEKIQNYNGYSHGEAVAIGMVAITTASEKIGETKVGTTERLVNLLRQKGLPTGTGDVSQEDIFANLWYDKKVENEAIKLIILKEIGSCKVKVADKKEVRKILEKGIIA